MRILQANNYHHIRGGSESVYFNTTDLLKGAGHDVVSFAARSPEDQESQYSDYFPDAPDSSHRRPADFRRFLRNSAARRALSRLILDHGPFDLAHLHIYYGRLTAAVLSELRAFGVPVVQTLHEYKLACPVYTMERAGKVCDLCVKGSTLSSLRFRCKEGSLARSTATLIEYWTSRLQGDVRLIDKFICVSDFQLRVMQRAGIPTAKLCRIYNFVEIPEALPLKAEKRSNHLLYFGRIEQLKGLPSLIKAVRETGHRLIIAGSGGWQREMELSIQSDIKIEYVGFLSGPSLRSLISTAKAVVVPSEWYENCPMSVLEAKAVGTPVIGARIGGIPELIRDGVDGFLFNPGDHIDIAEALESLDRTDRDAMAFSARSDAEARFSPAAHYKNLLSVYKGLVPGGTGPFDGVNAPSRRHRNIPL